MVPNCLLGSWPRKSFVWTVAVAVRMKKAVEMVRLSQRCLPFLLVSVHLEIVVLLKKFSPYSFG
jgi:hypothetical protein